MRFKIILILFWLIILIPIFSQEGSSNIDDAVKNKIDQFIENNNFSELENYLLDLEIESTSEIENFLFLRSQQALDSQKLPLAKKILELILLLNMDNFEAQELYLNIDKAIKEKEELERIAKEEKLKQKIEEKAKEEKEKQLDKKIEKEEAIAYFGPRNIKLMLDIAPLDMMFNSSQFSKDLNTQYGIAVSTSLYYVHPYFGFGIDGLYDGGYLSISGEKNIYTFYRAFAAIRIPRIPVPLYLTGGIAGLDLKFDDNTASNVSIEELISPIAGLKLRNIEIGSRLKWDSIVSYYLFSFLTPNLQSAFDLQTGLGIQLFQGKVLSLAIQTDVTSIFLIGQNKLENNTKIKLGARINFNE